MKQAALVQQQCPKNQTKVLSSSEVSKSLDISIGIISVILIILFIYYLYLFLRPKKEFNTSVFSRFSKFFDTTYSKITIVVVISFVVFGFLTALQTTIITPLVEASIPNLSLRKGFPLRTYNEETKDGTIETTVEMYPGRFLQFIFSFIITLCIIFIIYECCYQLSHFDFIKNNAGTFFKIVIIVLLLSLLIWNIYERTQQKDTLVCVNKDSSNKYLLP